MWGQTRLDVHDLRDGCTRGRVDSGIATVAGGVASDGKDARCGHGVLYDLAVLAAAFNGPIFAQSRASAKKRNQDGWNPTGGASPALALTEAATAQLRRPSGAASLLRECVVTSGKTPFRRRDEKPGDAPACGRKERGRQASGARMTTQCT